MRKVLLITGPAGDAQGWGDMSVTESMREAIEACGFGAEIAFTRSVEELNARLDKGGFDIVWSALYHISDKVDTIGPSAGEGNWVADILDVRGIPYIGPGASTMKTLLDKHATHKVLGAYGISVPENYLALPGGEMPRIGFPAFVKPASESRSVGISDESVVHSDDELRRRVNYVCETFGQPALVEEFLPGMECTVLLLGNGKRQEILPGVVEVSPEHYGRFNIFRSDLRGVGLTKVRRMEEGAAEAIALCEEAMRALGCLDHIRTDMRMAADGSLRIIEVNGIPGMKPVKSWSPQIYTLYHASPEGPLEDYNRLVELIVRSALERHGL